MGDVFTSAGEAWVVDACDAYTGTRYIGWGTGTHTAGKSDTALTTEASEARVVAAETQSAADTIQWQGTFIADANKTITEAMVCTDASGATTMILSSTFTGVGVLSASSYQLTFTLQFA